MKNIFKFFVKLFLENILICQKLNRNYLIVNGRGKGKSYSNIIVSKR